ARAFATEEISGLCRSEAFNCSRFRGDPESGDGLACSVRFAGFGIKSKATTIWRRGGILPPIFNKTLIFQPDRPKQPSKRLCVISLFALCAPSAPNRTNFCILWTGCTCMTEFIPMVLELPGKSRD